MGHFDILLLQTPQDLLKTALEAGAGDCFAGPCTLPGAPGRPLHLPLVDTLGKDLQKGLVTCEEEQAFHPQLAQGRSGGLSRECQTKGGEKVSQDHLESCQGL